MEVLVQAFADAVPVWEDVLLQLSWHHGFIVTAYLGAAWLCLLNADIARNAGDRSFIWYLAAVVLSLLAVNTMLHVDVLATQILRSVSKLEGWYGLRRPWQYGTVAVLVLIALWTARRLGRAFAASDESSVPVASGLTLLLALLALSTVSLHDTDAFFNLRLAGVSFGRLTELVGIGLVLQGALRCLRRH